MNYDKIIEKLRGEFIIIGLTGAVGSGCSETANFLSQTNIKFKKIFNCQMKKKEELIKNYDNLEPYRLKALMWFYSKYDWKPFKIIKVSNILFSIFLDNVIKKLKINEEVKYQDLINKLEKEDLKININDEEIKVRKIFKDLKNLKNINMKDLSLIKEIKDYNSLKQINKKLDKIDYFIKHFIEKNNEFFKIFQYFGKKIREGTSKKDLLYINLKTYGIKDIPSVFIIPKIIERIIKLMKEENKKNQFFIIDSLRNIYEIEFFKHKYSAFFLFSILANETYRKERILNNFKLGLSEYEKIKKFETDTQKINECIGRGDIFINNDFNSPYKDKLYYQLLKYIAIIRKPGLFTPTTDERFMQVALTARYNSGCISRQVGAVVVGDDGYIRGFGWNDVPENHIPCTYRTLNELLSCNDEIMFSEYERSEKFIKFVENNYKIKNPDMPFCFKDIQNKKELEKQKTEIIKDKDLDFTKKDINKILNKIKCKNPTRERALHAEENAFLQIAKIGGISVRNGTLYTTDSPCQLCSKKSMQLKIKRIVYIDAYPDISTTHTLKSGPKEEQPKFEIFKGASRKAYFKLYTPIIGKKEEINTNN